MSFSISTSTRQGVASSTIPRVHFTPDSLALESFSRGEIRKFLDIYPVP